MSTQTLESPKGYNGWTNYETWNVNLWLSNDEGSYHYWTEAAQEAWDATDEDEDRDTRLSDAKNNLADRLKDEINEGTPTVTGLYADLLNAALSEVDWYEIVSHWIDDADTQ